MLELLTADYTFVNERLAEHYGIPGVKGSHFRRVTLGDASRRGLLGKGSILAATSYAHRTSPVLQGQVDSGESARHAAAATTPEDVPDLKEDNAEGEVLSMRDRMVQHRANPVCASCHAMMDPLGLALEHYDAVGRWRTRSEAFTPIDASGTMLDGTTFDGVDGLREVLLSRSELFVTTLTEKLLTYGLGRGVESGDAPVVRAIVRTAADADYRFQALLMGIVKSLPFQMRRSSGRAGGGGGAVAGPVRPAGIDEVGIDEVRSSQSCSLRRRRCRGGRSCAGSARRWRCRCWTRWCRRSRRWRGRRRRRRGGSGSSTCRTGSR